jgi:hypothetical protein
MRRLVILAGVAALVGGCASLPGPTPLPAAAPAPQAQPQPQARPAEPSPPQVARQRPPAAVRVDNASLESFRTSWQRLRASLSPAQQTTLNSAVASLAFAGYGSPTTLPRNLRDSPIVPEMIRHRIDGMTYAEIVDLSREPPTGP